MEPGPKEWPNCRRSYPIAPPEPRRAATWLSERGNALSLFKADAHYCAVVGYRGSWDRPGTKGDTPNFDMPTVTDFVFGDADSTMRFTFHAAAAGSAIASDDRQRGRPSAHFPAKPRPFDRPVAQRFGARSTCSGRADV